MRITVKRKLIFGLFTIFTLSVLLLYSFMSNAIEKQTEENIIKDMKNLYLNSREYVEQLFKVNGLEFTEKDFINNGSLIVKGLGKVNSFYTTIYSTKGKTPYQYIPQDIQVPWNEINKRHNNILEEAIYNRSALRLSNFKYDNIHCYIADFVFPIYIDNNFIGIVRYTFDVSDMYRANKDLLRMLMFFVLVIFISIFLFSFILVHKLIEPLTELNTAFSHIAKGNYEGYLEKKRDDEIGDLTDSFNHMTDKIKEQIETINAEKKKILKLQQTRTEFFNNVTHELKTPLTSIYGYTQLLEGDVKDKKFYNRAVERIKFESNRLHKMVVDLIELSKNSSHESFIEFKTLNLSELIRVIVNDMAFKAERNSIAIEIVKSSDVFIKGDISKISELLINLLDNAIKYGYPDSNIKINLTKDNDNAIVDIENRGENIPKSYIDKVFEPFFRVENKSDEKGSSGLGLNICKSIIEKHRGNIRFLSENEIIRVIVSIPYIKN